MEANDLQTFITSALTTFGDIVDYKYFLPRILELIQYSETDVLDDFVTFEKLNYSKWKTWNDDEINAINNYLRFYGKLYFLFKEVGFV